MPMNNPDQNPRHIAHENKSFNRGCNVIIKERISLRIRPCFNINVNPKDAKSVRMRLTTNQLLFNSFIVDNLYTGIN